MREILEEYKEQEMGERERIVNWNEYLILTVLVSFFVMREVL